MKKIICISVMLGTVLMSAQNTATQNRFVYESDNTAVLEDKAPGAPTDPVPVDTYFPFLWAAAAGMASYYGKKKMKLS